MASVKIKRVFLEIKRNECMTKRWKKKRKRKEERKTYTHTHRESNDIGHIYLAFQPEPA